MSKAKKIILGAVSGVIALLAILAIIVAMQPSDFRVTRSMKMAASPQAVFNQVNNLKRWEQWSPWAKLDPNVKMQYEGPEEGAGAKYSWEGNSQVGAGSNTITESKPDEMIRMNLHFIKPMEGTNTVDFTFEPKGESTLVTWSMYGPNNFIGKAIGLVMNCDKMVGDSFTEGLTSIKHIVETPGNDTATSATH